MKTKNCAAVCAAIFCSAAALFAFTVTGCEPPVPVSSIEILSTGTADGSRLKIEVNVEPANASNQALNWSVSNSSVATVNSAGLLLPVKDGSVTVTASAADGSGVSASKTLTVAGTTLTAETASDGGIIVSNEKQLLSALSNASSTKKIYVRGKTYYLTAKVSLSKIDSAGSPICVYAYEGDSERPLIDFYTMEENSSNRGIEISGSFWHVKGIDIARAGDNGMFISGDYNLIEFCTFSECSDTGLQIGNGAANNTILNCDSYWNADSLIENADGFACKLDAGTGNKFIGCRAWQNLDDGWDGYLRYKTGETPPNPPITTTYENCWAFWNGKLKSGRTSGGDGNGFKTGGSDEEQGEKKLKHNAVYVRCIAAGNVVDGFDHNSNRGAVTLINCGAYGNGANINFGSSNSASSLRVVNTVSLSGSDSFIADTTVIENNGWQNGKSTSSADFESLDMSLLVSPRKADGSLPDIAFLRLAAGSDLINAGASPTDSAVSGANLANYGLSLTYTDSAPDIGPFESSY